MNKVLKSIILFFVGQVLISCSSEELSGIGDKSDILSWYNSKLADYVKLCQCSPQSMYELYASDNEDMIYWKINHNFREEVVYKGMERDIFLQEIEKHFKNPIKRFCDIKVNPQFGRSFEPSSLVSEDGKKMEVFSSNGLLFETEDGINWSDGIKLNKALGHSSINKVDGLYMMVGVSSDGNYFDLYTSTDKINYDFRGHLMSKYIDIGNGDRFDNLGNSYLLKTKDGTYYLYYEGATHKSNWEICLMTCDDLYAKREDGFVGNWKQCPNNPIMPCTKKDFAGETTHVYCNPEIAKGEDNQPLIVDGKYYMYYLSYFYKGNIYYTTLCRAFSTDLIHWTEEGTIFDNRDIPEGGEARGDNGDQSLCQFKGKTYLFYTHNINSKGYSVPNIRYAVDNRPLEVLLRLKP